MRNRVVAIGAVFVASALPLTACGGGGSDTKGAAPTPIKLVAAEYSASTKAFWDPYATD